MKLEVAKAIVEAANEIGLDGVRIYEDYSGRGMYGKTTTGIVVDSEGDLLKAVALAAGRVATGEHPGVDLDDFVDSLDLSSDSMGRSKIVY